MDNDKDEVIIGRFNHWDPRNRIATNGLGIFIAPLLAVPAMYFSIAILIRAGYSPYIVLWFFLLGIPAIFIHESIRIAAQWFLSKQRPQWGFRFPFPYSKLHSNVSISRNKGILCAMSPFLFITIVSLLLIPFSKPITQVALIMIVYVHTMIYTGDFNFTHWLLKHPKDARLRAEGFESIMFFVPLPSKGYIS